MACPKLTSMHAQIITNVLRGSDDKFQQEVKLATGAHGPYETEGYALDILRALNAIIFKRVSEKAYGTERKKPGRKSAAEKAAAAGELQ